MEGLGLIVQFFKIPLDFLKETMALTDFLFLLQVPSPELSCFLLIC